MADGLPLSSYDVADNKGKAALATQVIVGFGTEDALEKDRTSRFRRSTRVVFILLSYK